MYKALITMLFLLAMLAAQVVAAQEMSSMSMDDGMKDEMMMGGEYSATIGKGPARIRAEASMEGEVLGHCQVGQDLTVWLPAVGDWLASSCLEVNGFIHKSLVKIGEMVKHDDAMMKDDSKMMDDGMKKDAMMDDGMKKDAMMDDGMKKDAMMDDGMKDKMMMGGEYSATISPGMGRARIRAEAGMEGEIVGHCERGSMLTVWLPAVGEWLTASCYGTNGYIHESLVEVGDAVIPKISDLAMSADDGMMKKDDMSMEEGM